MSIPNAAAEAHRNLPAIRDFRVLDLPEPAGMDSYRQATVLQVFSVGCSIYLEKPITGWVHGGKLSLNRPTYPTRSVQGTPSKLE